MMNLNQARPQSRQGVTMSNPPAEIQQGLTPIRPNNNNPLPVMNFDGIEFPIFPKGSSLEFKQSTTTNLDQIQKVLVDAIWRIQSTDRQKIRVCTALSGYFTKLNNGTLRKDTYDQSRKFLCYAVLKGWNPGIYKNWNMVVPQITNFVGAKWRGCYTFEDARKMMIEHIGDDSFLIDPFFRNQVKNFTVENDDPPVENKSSLDNWISFKQAFPRKYRKHETDKETIYEKTRSYLFFNRISYVNRLPLKSRQIIIQKAEHSFWEPFWATQRMAQDMISRHDNSWGIVPEYFKNDQGNLDFCIYKFTIYLDNFIDLFLESKHFISEQTFLDYGLIDTIIGTPDAFKQSKFGTMIKEAARHCASFLDSSDRFRALHIKMKIYSIPPEWIHMDIRPSFHKIYVQGIYGKHDPPTPDPNTRCDKNPLIQLKNWTGYSLAHVSEFNESDFYMIYQNRIYNIFLNGDYFPLWRTLTTELDNIA